MGHDRSLLVNEKNKHMKKLLVLGIAAMAVATLSARADDAKTTYDKSCAMCHGADGKGATQKWARNWASKTSRMPKSRQT